MHVKDLYSIHVTVRSAATSTWGGSMSTSCLRRRGSCTSWRRRSLLSRCIHGAQPSLVAARTGALKRSANVPCSSNSACLSTALRVEDLMRWLIHFNDRPFVHGSRLTCTNPKEELDEESRHRRNAAIRRACYG